jgi:hypothetical protein
LDVKCENIYITSTDFGYSTQSAAFIGERARASVEKSKNGTARRCKSKNFERQRREAGADRAREWEWG